MQLLNIIKSLILEGKVLIKRFDLDGTNINIYFNTHSNIAQNSSSYGRQSIDDITNSMIDILDIILSVSLDILNHPSKIEGKQHSILVKDYMIGVDYHFWVDKSPKDDLYLTINTSIAHPKNLPSKKNDKKIIITRTGDTVIKESMDYLLFTKLVRNNIIIYHN